MAMIQALALSSSLGALTQACAAFRAGLSGFGPAPDFETFDRGDDEPQPVMVAAVPIATFGFSGFGRLVALGQELFTDLAARADLARLAQGSIHLALPDPDERGIELFADEELAERRVGALGNRLLDRLAANGAPLWAGARHFYGGGHTAFARALRGALDDLGGSTTRSCVVGALDSLVLPPVLDALADEGRLKTAHNPVGLIPGEAAAALVLANQRPVLPPVRVRGVELALVPPRNDDVPADGRALATCALGLVGAAPGEPLALVSDHNGEQHRALEWGLVVRHLRAAHESFTVARGTFPAMGFGDVGAASGAVAAAVAARAIHHGYATAPRTLVLSSSDEGERAAFLLDGR